MMIGFVNCSYPAICSNYTGASTIVGYINESTAPIDCVQELCLCGVQ